LPDGLTLAGDRALDLVEVWTKLLNAEPKPGNVGWLGYLSAPADPDTTGVWLRLAEGVFHGFVTSFRVQSSMPQSISRLGTGAKEKASCRIDGGVYSEEGEWLIRPGYTFR
jgi:hypothetical protein